MTSSTLTAPAPQVAGHARDVEPGRRRRRRHDRWIAVAFAAPLLAYELGGTLRVDHCGGSRWVAGGYGDELVEVTDHVDPEVSQLDDELR